MAAKTRKDKSGRELAKSRRGGSRREIVVATRAERLDDRRQVALGVKTQDDAEAAGQSEGEAGGKGSGKGS